MVSRFSTKDQDLLNLALTAAEAKTSARISVVVLPISSSYQDFALAYGIIVGSIVASALWYLHVSRSFPFLLSVQLGVVLTSDLIHGFTSLIVRLVPRKVRHHRAAEIARREYHVLDGPLPKDFPFVLLFVSLSERYVHVVTGPIVHRAIPEGWHKVTDAFGKSVRKVGVRRSCIEAVEEISNSLAPHFSASETTSG